MRKALISLVPGMIMINANWIKMLLIDISFLSWSSDKQRKVTTLIRSVCLYVSGDIQMYSIKAHWEKDGDTLTRQ